MTPLSGQPVLTAAAMRAAEAAAIEQGATVDSLMARAGQEVARVVRRVGSGAPVLVVCGPGNNGGDGYVVAATLLAAGHKVRVAASAEPRSEVAKHARLGWTGPVEALESAAPAPILVDALFGTGLSRALDDSLCAALTRLVHGARLAIAVDLPSGVATDDGAVLSKIPAFHLTLALGAAKPSHLLQPAARFCGQVRVLDIGVHPDTDDRVLERPWIADPGPDSHKYSRGMVAIVGGTMPGAAEMAAEAALRSGAGYVLLLDGTAGGSPHAIVRKPWAPDVLDDPRIDTVLIGPGLGRGDDAAAKLDHALASGHKLVIDGDALHLLAGDRLDRLAAREEISVLTPHAGEFSALFGKPQGSKAEAARVAAKRAGAYVVFKGADTVIAAPFGHLLFAETSSGWLSTAGTGDVLAGAIAAALASNYMPLNCIGRGVWLHAEAARRLGPSFLADDLAHALSATIASL